MSRLKFAKYKTKGNKRVFSLISQGIDEGYSLIEPKASYEIFDARISGERIRLIGAGLTIKSASLARRLKGVSKAALFVCSVGGGLSRRVGEYVAKGEIAKAAILDAVGSESAEALAEKAGRIISAEAAREGLSALKRFSPGYGGWTLLDQPKILKVLKAGKIGVRLTKSFIMVPEKSVTACIGLIKGPPQRAKRP